MGLRNGTYETIIDVLVRHWTYRKGTPSCDQGKASLTAKSLGVPIKDKVVKRINEE